MNRRFAAACGLLATAFTASSQAAQVAWTFTGTVSERFDAVSDDPIADLLGVSRASINELSYALRIVVDTAAARDVLLNNSAVQQVKYEDAIVSAEFTLNGVSFATLRRPSEFFGGAFDESEIRVTNQAAPGGTDNLTLTLGTPFAPGLTPALFASYTVPFNQSIGATPVANAEVHALFHSVNISGPGMFGSTDLPAANGAFSGANFVAIGATLLADFGLGFGNGGMILELQEASFTASPVPLPAPALTLGAALAALALRRHRRAR